MSRLRTETVLIGNKGHGVFLAIGSDPFVAALNLQGLIFLALVLDIGLLLAGRAIACLITVELIEKMKKIKK